MSTDLLKYLADKNNEEIKVLTEELALGKAKDHGDYKYVCGIIRGLMIANSKLADTEERMKDDDDAF